MTRQGAVWSIFSQIAYLFTSKLLPELKSTSWLKLSLLQLTYEIRINHETVKKVDNRKPCLFRGVKVFAGAPSSEYRNVRAKIRALFFSTSGTAIHTFFLINISAQIKKTVGSVLWTSGLALYLIMVREYFFLVQT